MAMRTAKEMLLLVVEWPLSTLVFLPSADASTKWTEQGW